MKYILLFFLLFSTINSFCAKNIINDLEFDSEIFNPKVTFENPHSSIEIIKLLGKIQDIGARLEITSRFLENASTSEIRTFYKEFLKSNQEAHKYDRKILFMIEFRLLNQEDPESLMRFLWHLNDFSDGFSKDSWDNFIVACIMFSISENEHRIKLDISDNKNDDENKLSPDPYHAMEKAIMLSDSAELHYLIAQVFRQLAYTNVKAHKIVVLELEKAEAILKIQNIKSYKLFLGKEINFLRDFIELYKFYKSDPPFYIEEALYSKMAELNEKDSIALNNLADLYLRYNTKIKQAKKALDKAISIDGNNPAIIDTLGFYYLKTGDIKKAEKTLLKAISLKPNMEIAHVHLAELYYLKGESDKNIQQYEKLIKLSPDNPEYFNDLGYQLAESGKSLSRAIALCQKAVMLTKGKPAFLDSLAWAYYKNNEFEKAKENIEKAMSEEKNEKFIFYHAGEIYFKLKEFKLAIQNFNEALKLYPEWKEVTKKLGILILLEEKDISEEQAIKMWR